VDVEEPARRLVWPVGRSCEVGFAAVAEDGGAGHIAELDGGVPVGAGPVDRRADDDVDRASPQDASPGAEDPAGVAHGDGDATDSPGDTPRSSRPAAMARASWRSSQ
jgi:hypothetical protein